MGAEDGKPLEEYNPHETHSTSRSMPSDKIKLTDDEDARTDVKSTESREQQRRFQRRCWLRRHRLKCRFQASNPPFILILAGHFGPLDDAFT